MPSISFYLISNVIKDLSEFDFPPQIIDFLKQKSGLLVITGPHGSGKSSLLTSFLENINNNKKKRIITIENLIEYNLLSKKSIIEQRQKGNDFQKFSEGIEYCLNEDIDVVGIGEMGDEELKESLPAIIDLASGNTLVFLEINAGSYIRALEKMLYFLKQKLNSNAAQHALADSLYGIISLKILPKVGGGILLAKGIMINNTTISSFIREEKIYQIENIVNTSRKEGMINIEKAVEELEKEGLVGDNFDSDLEKIKGDSNKKGHLII